MAELAAVAFSHIVWLVSFGFLRCCLVGFATGWVGCCMVRFVVVQSICLLLFNSVVSRLFLFGSVCCCLLGFAVGYSLVELAGLLLHLLLFV